MYKLRRENGTGTIAKMQGNRRKPYIVRVQDGYKYDKDGKASINYKIIGYAKTKNDGKMMLKEYYTKGRFFSNITFAEVFERFKDWKYPEISKSYQNIHNNSFNICRDLHEMIFTDISLEDLQDIIDSCGKNYPTLRKVKLLLVQIYGYAIRNGHCKKNYAEGVNIIKYRNQKQLQSKRTRINKEHIQLFWIKSELPYYQMILFMIYTGVRVSEMLNIRKENVNLDEQYFDIFISKNANGIRRVPIADIIYPFVIEWYNKDANCEYLFHTNSGIQFKYRNYYDSYFTPLMNECGLLYTPHFCRHTFVSMMADCNADPIITKKIIGHGYNASITEKVYTHNEVKAMLREVNKLKDWSDLGEQDICRTS